MQHRLSWAASNRCESRAVVTTIVRRGAATGSGIVHRSPEAADPTLTEIRFTLQSVLVVIETITTTATVTAAETNSGVARLLSIPAATWTRQVGHQKTATGFVGVVDAISLTPATSENAIQVSTCEITTPTQQPDPLHIRLLQPIGRSTPEMSIELGNRRVSGDQRTLQRPQRIHLVRPQSGVRTRNKLVVQLPVQHQTACCVRQIAEPIQPGQIPVHIQVNQ